MFYVILTISYLRTQTIETSSLPTYSSRPLFKQIEIFSMLTVWLYISTVSTFLNISASYYSASSGFRLLGEIPPGAIIEYRWQRIVCRLLLSPAITQWSIFMVSTGLFQAFRWAENGASGEQRENNKRAGIEKESNMSIAQWRLHFHCQRIRPTQLFDPQLIMYFFFILRLLNTVFW